MRVSLLSWIIALLALLGLLAGCSKDGSESPDASTTTAPTTAATTPTTSTPPAQEPGRENLTVEYDHCGLHFKLDSTYTVGLQEDDKNVFTFSNDQVDGTVAFGKLSELGNGAKTSQEYANLLLAKYDAEKAWIGTSTGFGYYVINSADGYTAECLYIHGEYAWLVEAQSSNKDFVEAMIQIIGRCGLNAEEIPA